MSKTPDSMFLNLMSSAVQTESKVEPLLTSIFNEISEGNKKEEKQTGFVKDLQDKLDDLDKRKTKIDTDSLSSLLGSATKTTANPLAIGGITAPGKMSIKQQGKLQTKDMTASLISGVFANIKKGVKGVAKAGAGMAKFLGKAELKLFVGGFKLMGKAMAPFGKVMGLMGKAAFGPFGDIMDIFTDLGEMLSIGFVPMIVDIQVLLLKLQPTMLMIAGWITDIYNAIKGFLSGDLSSGEVTDILSGILTQVFDILAEFLPVLMEMITTFVPMLLNLIVEFAPVILGFLTNLLVMIVDLIVQNLPMIIDIVVSTLLTLIDLIIESLPIIVSAILQLIPMLVNVIVENLPIIISTLLELVPMVIEIIVDAIPVILDAVIDIFMLLVEVLTDNLPMVIDIVIDTIILLIDALIDAMPLVIQAIVNAIPMIIGALGEALPVVMQFLVLELPGMLIEALGVGITTLIQAIPDLVVGVGKQIIDAIFGTNLSDAVDDAVKIIAEIPSRTEDVYVGGWAE